MSNLTLGSLGFSENPSKAFVINFLFKGATQHFLHFFHDLTSRELSPPRVHTRIHEAFTRLLLQPCLHQVHFHYFMSNLEQVWREFSRYLPLVSVGWLWRKSARLPTLFSPFFSSLFFTISYISFVFCIYFVLQVMEQSEVVLYVQEA